MVIVVFQISPHVSFLPPVIMERKYLKIGKAKPLSELFQNPQVSSEMTHYIIFFNSKRKAACTPVLFQPDFMFLQLNLDQSNQILKT